MVATVLVALASFLGALLFRRVRCCIGITQLWRASLLLESRAQWALVP